MRAQREKTLGTATFCSPDGEKRRKVELNMAGMVDRLSTSSYVLWPVVVWHDAGPCPFLAIGVRALAGNEAIVCVLED
jgi:hypothetical protein